MSNEVQEEIILLNVMRYKNERGEGCRLSFILSDQMQDSQNYCGYAVLDQFYNSYDLFNKIKKEFLLEPLVATFRIETNKNNPLKTRSILCRLESDSDVIDLL